MTVLRAEENGASTTETSVLHPPVQVSNKPVIIQDQTGSFLNLYTPEPEPQSRRRL